MGNDISKKTSNNLFVNNTLLVKDILNMTEEQYGKQMEISPLKKRTGDFQISTFYNLQLSSEIKYNENTITAFDISISDTFYTLYRMGNTRFTIEDVGRILYGDPTHRLTKKQKEQIRESVDKLSMSKLSITCTEEWKARKLKSDASSFEGFSAFMPVKGVKIKVKGYEIEGYYMDEPPMAYSYAEAIGQIIAVPLSLLACSGNTTEESMLLKKVLLKRIEIVKNKNNNISSSRIKYGGTSECKGIFGEIGCTESNYSPAAWKNKKSKLHKSVIACLDTLILNNYISSYQILEDGCSISGVEIFL